MAKDKYPHPMKGQRVKCLGCKDGKVLVNGVQLPCRACAGTGFVVA